MFSVVNLHLVFAAISVLKETCISRVIQQCYVKWF